MKQESIYDFEFLQPSGRSFDFSQLKNKVVLIVNTATQCGLSNQLTELNVLYNTYKDQGLVIIGFPCNQFKKQEPESNETIEAACAINFGVEFPLMQISDVNGPHTNEVFKFLKQKQTGFLGSRIKWNFTKFLIDKKGSVVKRYAPYVKPYKIESKIVQLLEN